MLSNQTVQRYAQLFVCVHIDPRDPDADDTAYKHKSTGYVPEVVFLDVRDDSEKVVARLKNHRSVDEMLNLMKKALARVKS